MIPTTAVKLFGGFVLIPIQWAAVSKALEDIIEAVQKCLKKINKSVIVLIPAKPPFMAYPTKNLHISIHRIESTIV